MSECSQVKYFVLCTLQLDYNLYTFKNTYAYLIERTYTIMYVCVCVHM